MAGEKVLIFFFPPKISEMRLGRWCGAAKLFANNMDSPTLTKSFLCNFYVGTLMTVAWERRSRCETFWSLLESLIFYQTDLHIVPWPTHKYLTDGIRGVRDDHSFERANTL